MLLIEKVVFVPESLENDARDNEKVDERFRLTCEKKRRKHFFLSFRLLVSIMSCQLC